MSRTAEILMGLACAALWLPGAAGAATLSDSFAGRESVKGVPVQVLGSTVGASREAGEPVPNTLGPAGRSVWLEWEAEQQGYYTLSTCGSSIPTVLAVYSGSALATLSEVDSASNFGGAECSAIRDGLTFQVLVTGKYQVLVDGNGFFVPFAPPPPTEGPVSLRIEATPPAPNDDFAQATAIDGRTSEEPDGTRRYVAHAFGYTWNATKQGGEPKHAGDSGGSSVWYTWTASESGLARISMCCGSAKLVGVYTGDAVGALTEVKSGKGFAEAPVTAGTTYRIVVDSEFSLFLGGPLDDRFNLLLLMELAPGPGYSLGTDDDAGSRTPIASDLVAPKTTILKKRIRPKAHMASFSFTSNERGSSYRCQLDRRKAVACTSPKSFKGLARGRHVFKIYAIDAAGNADQTPAKAQFSIREPRQGRG